MRYSTLIDSVARRLQSASLWFGHGAANARDEAWYLVAAAAQLAPEALDVKASVTTDLVSRCDALVEQRIQTRKPLPYLTGEASFYGMPLYCSDQVLVPRSPIGELMWKGLYPWLDHQPQHIVDVGTGSGSLAITAAQCFPQAQVTALDLSEQALDLCQRNVDRHGLQSRIAVGFSDGLSSCAGLHFDVILSNPPYVPWQEYQALPAEYHHEPRLALLSHDEGLGFARVLLRDALQHLKPNGLLVVEVGNSMDALLERWPDFPADWPDFEQGGRGVFIITTQDLAEWRLRHPAL